MSENAALNETVADELRAQVAEHLEQDSSAMPRLLAQELGAPEERIIAALPEAMRRRAPLDDFAELWRRMVAWGEVTFLACNAGAVIEFSGQLPEGRFGWGMFNIGKPGAPFGGHLMVSQLHCAWLVAKPMFNLESRSVQFFDARGEFSFGVYLGRDAEKRIIPSQLRDFEALWDECGEGGAS